MHIRKSLRVTLKVLFCLSVYVLITVTYDLKLKEESLGKKEG